MAYLTAFVAHADCGRHDTGWAHPEHQGRLPAILNAIYEDTPALLDVVLQAEAVPASESDLLRVHTPAHLERVRAAVREATRQETPVHLDADTVVSAVSWEAAVAAAGSAITAVRLVLTGEVGSAFALSRPPGHHAGVETAMGFCLFNNVAIAARWAQANHDIERVLIVDWDVHHGNGTQDIFYRDAKVYFLSVHQSPHYPGTGSAEEEGAGPGYGATLNIPVAAGVSRAEYMEAFDAALDTAVRASSPELVLISAGMDCLNGDPLGGLSLEPQDIHRMTRRVVERARAPVVAVLEGGYEPSRAGLAVVNALRAFGQLPAKD